MPFHQPGGKIPHRMLTPQPTHLIMRLAGSVPKAELARLKKEREESLNQLFNAPERDISEYIKAGKSRINGLYHLGLDDSLHGKSSGPYFMSDPKVATIVMNALRWAENQNRWFLYAACVMGNHLHAVVRSPDGETEASLRRIIQDFKRHTARQANLILDRTGEAFWAPVYYDRDVRVGKFDTVIWYVLNNPVKAGLVANWKDWPHTYLHPDYRELYDG